MTEKLLKLEQAFIEALPAFELIADLLNMAYELDPEGFEKLAKEANSNDR